MIKNFYFFRHGETPWNLQRRCQGHTDTELNDTGRMQAKRLAKVLNSHDIEVIYCSDLKRAAQTAEILHNDLAINTPLVMDSRLRETHLGEAEGMLLEEIKKKFGEHSWSNVFKEGILSEQSFPGGESSRTVVKRVENLLHEISYFSPYQRIALGTHGGVLRCLTSYFGSAPKKQFAIPNCSIFHFTCHVPTKKWSFSAGPW